MDKFTTTSRGTVHLRRALPQDASSFRLLRLEALRTNPEAFSGDLSYNLGLSGDEWIDRTQKAATSGDQAVFFADYEGDLIGMSGVHLGSSEKTCHNAQLFGVFLKPAWRGLHLGADLVQACVIWAQTRQAHSVKLGVNAANVSAIRCYAQCGFQVYGLEPHGLQIGGRYYDLMLMYLKL